jgi:hypothetical protein
MTKAMLFVFSQPKSEDVEASYNDWYDNVHMREVVQDVDGIVSCTRYALSDAQLQTVPGVVPRYLATYAIESNDVAATLKNMVETQPGRTMSDAIERDPMPLILVFEETTPTFSKSLDHA